MAVCALRRRGARAQAPRELGARRAVAGRRLRGPQSPGILATEPAVGPRAPRADRRGERPDRRHAEQSARRNRRRSIWPPQERAAQSGGGAARAAMSRGGGGRGRRGHPSCRGPGPRRAVLRDRVSADVPAGVHHPELQEATDAVARRASFIHPVHRGVLLLHGVVGDAGGRGGGSSLSRPRYTFLARGNLRSGPDILRDRRARRAWGIWR